MRAAFIGAVGVADASDSVAFTFDACLMLLAATYSVGVVDASDVASF